MDGEVVLNLQRLRHVQVDDAERTVTAGAGATIQSIQAAAAAAGMFYGVDLASRGSATVGGTIATNAGGLRVMRYGDTRAQILGMDVAFSTGRVVSGIDRPRRDNCGYHLPSLMCGSEGTLGVITAATLRLHRPPRRRSVILAGASSIEDAVALAQAARELASVSAVEYMEGSGLEIVADLIGRRPPVRSAHAVLIEVTDGDPLENLVEGLRDAEAAVAGDDPRSVSELWAWRERHTEAISHVGVPVKMDVTLPLASVGSFVDTVRRHIRRVHEAAQVWFFGHLADGNLHVNVTGAPDQAETIQDMVFGLVVDLGGSISSEHGIGRAKRTWLPKARSKPELEVLRSIKDALDPAGVLNPGVLLPALSADGR